MKKAIILIVLLILLVPLASARKETAEFKVGETMLIQNVNVTLLNADEKDNKLVICINSQKGILEEKEERKVNNVIVDVREIRQNYAKLILDVDCKNCACNTADCSNAACFPKKIPEETIKNTTLPNPASVYCKEQNGNLEIRYLEDGSQIGYCIFDDYECEEWAFYKKECPVQQSTEKTILQKILGWLRNLF